MKVDACDSFDVDMPDKCHHVLVKDRNLKARQGGFIRWSYEEIIGETFNLGTKGLSGFVKLEPFSHLPS